MVISPQWATCMRPWIGPKKLSDLIMWTRVPLGTTGYNFKFQFSIKQLHLNFKFEFNNDSLDFLLPSYRQMMIWELIDRRWTGMLHRPIHATGLFLNPAFSYKCDFNFDGEVMEGLYTCLHKMVPDYETREEINREI